MDKGNFMLRPTFSLGQLAQPSAPSGGGAFIHREYEDNVTTEMTSLSV
jgi:hypothetical protein